ncbi:MAG: TetR/AcrR family transcriptional regulator [Myxococcota bacterium]
MPTTSELPNQKPARDGAENGARRRILAAAIQVFGTYGFGKSTVEDIAAAAGVSKPLFYRQFKNKHDVFEAVIEQVFGDWHEAMIEQVDRTTGSTAQTLRALFVGVLQYAQARPLLNHLLARDSQLLLSTQSGVWTRACAALRDLIEQILRRGIAAGEVRTDIPVEQMADLLMEISFVYTNRQLHTGLAIERERAENLAECLFGAVSARSAPSASSGSLEGATGFASTPRPARGTAGA